MIQIRQIKVRVEDDSLSVLKKKVIKKYHLSEKEIKSFEITKKSIDARKKEEIYYVYEVQISLKKEDAFFKRNTDKNISKIMATKMKVEITGNLELKYRPVIVGSGPAGLFCAYFLAKYGYQPIIVEQGEPIEKRVKKVEEFFETGKLDVFTNVSFGEGGAGTFSDGKLNTLVSDKKNLMKEVFTILVENGAPKEILYLNKPHIGTDLLRKVMINIRKKIIAYGGEFHFSTKLTNIEVESSRLKRIQLNGNEWLFCDLLVLAIGNGARDTFQMLYDNHLKMSAKPFAVGVRISHPQEMINKSQYGNYQELYPASYKLTYTTKSNRGVYSFCMCPGGYVINSSSFPEELVINGMSNHKRDTKNSNSAIVVTVNSNDYGNGVLDGMFFQEELEKKAYLLGNGKIPVQLYKDFKENKKSKEFLGVEPIFKGSYAFANLNLLFPKEIADSIKESIDYFDTKIKGFNRDDAIIAGVESRTSSPVRIERDENMEANIRGIYPCGEGSGYAGGITTSAMDGIKVFLEVIKKYKC